MSTDIERYRPHGEVDSWSDVMPSVVKLAEYISATEFVPKTLKDRPAAIAAAILTGREMGIGPMRALAHVYMVEGKPSLSAEQKRAAALAAGHDIAYVESTTERCIVKGRRAGSETWSTVTFTLDDAKKAGLAGRDNYRKWPRRMLQARATGELVDLLFPDASAGLATTEEVLDDSDTGSIETEGETAPKGRRAKRRTSVKAQPEARETHVIETASSDETPQPPQPPLPGEEGYDEPSDTPQDGADSHVNDAQKRKIMALFRELEISDRDERLRITSGIVNRRIDSANELSSNDARALIDVLEAAKASGQGVDYLAALLAQQAEQQELGTDEG